MFNFTTDAARRPPNTKPEPRRNDFYASRPLRTWTDLCPIYSGLTVNNWTKNSNINSAELHRDLHAQVDYLKYDTANV